MKKLIPLFLLVCSLSANADGPNSGLAPPVHPERPHCDQRMDDDKISLACNIYWEGRNQSVQGMMAIAAVTMWRVKDPQFPNTIGKVVWQQAFSKKAGRKIAQFSWTLDGKKDRPLKAEMREWKWALAIASMFAMSAEEKAMACPQIATTKKVWSMLEKQGVPVKRRPIPCDVYTDKYELLTALDPTDGSVMFHADYVNPYWRKSFAFVVKVGDHLFYRKTDQES